MGRYCASQNIMRHGCAFYCADEAGGGADGSRDGAVAVVTIACGVIVADEFISTRHY